MTFQFYENVIKQKMLSFGIQKIMKFIVYQQLRMAIELTNVLNTVLFFKHNKN
jgi:hypothetical protein